MILLSVTGYAQGPKELTASSSRQWSTNSSTLGFSIKLPDIFKTGSAPLSGTVQYQPADSLYKGMILFVSRVGNATEQVLQDRYTQLLSSLKHQDETKVDEKHMSRSDFVVASHAYDDDEVDAHGKEQKLFWYEKGILTPSGVYEISLRYLPEYRKAVTAIIPRIVGSFQTQDKQAFIQH